MSKLLPFTVELGAGYSAAAPTEIYVLLSPKSSVPGNKGKLILWHHGTGGETIFASPVWRLDAAGVTNVRSNLHDKMLHPLLTSGYSILSCDYGGKETFGNDKNMSRINDAVAWAHTVKGYDTTKVGLIGESMGSGSVFQWASVNPAKAAFIMTYLSAGDYDDVYANVAGFNTKMDAAYNAPNSPVGGWLANSANHNPASPNVYGPVKNAGISWRAYYASDDPIANPDKILALGVLMGQPDHVINLGPGGHSDTSMATLDTNDMLRFVIDSGW